MKQRALLELSIDSKRSHTLLSVDGRREGTELNAGMISRTLTSARHILGTLALRVGPSAILCSTMLNAKTGE